MKRARQWCGLISNYFDHLFSLAVYLISFNSFLVQNQIKIFLHNRRTKNSATFWNFLLVQILQHLQVWTADLQNEHIIQMSNGPIQWLCRVVYRRDYRYTDMKIVIYGVKIYRLMMILNINTSHMQFLHTSQRTTSKITVSGLSQKQQQIPFIGMSKSGGTVSLCPIFLDLSRHAVIASV